MSGNPTGNVRQAPVPIPDGDTPRLNLARQVRALRDEGLTLAEAAVRLGITRSWASSVDTDPDGSKVRARKDGYRGSCIDCGKRTDGSNGASRAPERCAHCAPRQNAVWSRERIIDAIRDFYAEHGRVPTAVEFGAGVTNAEHVAWLPFYSTLRFWFGTAEAAIRAAGFEPRPAGRYARPSSVTRRDR